MEDTTAPALAVPDPITVEQEGPDGTPATSATIAAFLAAASATDIVDASPTIAHDGPAAFPQGVTTVTWTATDASGNVATRTSTVTVVDTRPPDILSAIADPDTLWPPNHKMRDITVAVEAQDIADPAPTSRIVSVTSNEPIDGSGDGTTDPDWEITGDLALKLRAERSGGGSGRIYTLHIECTRASGNVSTTEVTVTVPHDQGKGKRESASSLGVSITSASAVPTRIGAQITFTLTTDAEVSAAVLNLAGRPVKRLCTSKPLSAGANTLLWNASTDTGLQAPTGRYLLRIEASAPDGGRSHVLVPMSLGR